MSEVKQQTGMRRNLKKKISRWATNILTKRGDLRGPRTIMFYELIIWIAQLRVNLKVKSRGKNKTSQELEYSLFLPWLSFSNSHHFGRSPEKHIIWKMQNLCKEQESRIPRTRSEKSWQMPLPIPLLKLAQTLAVYWQIRPLEKHKNLPRSS